MTYYNYVQMSTLYETNKTEIIGLITEQKNIYNIYKFRQFLYSLNRDIRQRCFDISRQFLENEYHKNAAITITERERLLNLINHWQWNTFDTTSELWWQALSFNHAKSLSLLTMVHLWIDDMNTFETSTDGLR